MGKIEKISAPRGMPDTLPSDMPLIRRIEEAAHRVFRALRLRGNPHADVRGDAPLRPRHRRGDRHRREGDVHVRRRGRIRRPPEIPSRCGRRAPRRSSGRWSSMSCSSSRGSGSSTTSARCSGRSARRPAGCGSSTRSAARRSGPASRRWTRRASCSPRGSSGKSGFPASQVKINTIGCPNCRAGYREVLRGLLAPRRAELCEDCRSRFDRNVFRVLDCKNPACREIARAVPPMREHLDAECRAHFEAVDGASDARRARVQGGRSPRARVRLLHADGLRAVASRAGRPRRGLRRRAVRQPRRRTRRPAGRLRRVRGRRRPDDPGAAEETGAAAAGAGAARMFTSSRSTTRSARKSST